MEAHEQAAGRGMRSSMQHNIEACMSPAKGKAVLRETRVHTGLGATDQPELVPHH